LLSASMRCCSERLGVVISLSRVADVILTLCC
jgi:hypothetical protein